MERPLVSVIVPVYNVENFLEKCVRSIVFQTFRDIEIILVDDGSQDSSGNICDELANKFNNIKVIHKSNGGLSSARNAGLNIAKGEKLLFVDSDDYIHPQMIELLYDAMEFLKVHVVECGYTKVYSDFSTYKIKDVTLRQDKTEFFIKSVLSWKEHYPMVWNKMYDSKVFLKYRFKEGKINEDEFYLNQWIVEVESVGLINLPLYFYRVRKNSIMGKTYSIERLAAFEAYLERYKILKIHYPNLTQQMLWLITSQYFNKLKLVTDGGEDKLFEIRNQMTDIVLTVADDILTCSSVTANDKKLIEKCRDNRQEFFKELCKK